MAGDYAHVDLDRLRAPQPLELARLQHPQQLGLNVERQLADLVEEECRSVRDLEAADLARHGAGEGSPLPAEQLALHEARGQRGAVDFDHQLASTGTESVDRLGDELLARAGLAADQHQGVRERNLLHLPQDLMDRGALPVDLAVRVDDPYLGLEVVTFRLEPVLQSRDLRVRLPQGLLAPAPLRDVAEDAIRLDGAPVGIARGHAGHVAHPPLSPSRVQVAILGGERREAPAVKFLALGCHALTVVRVQVIGPELHRLEALP